MNILVPDSWLREFVKTKASPKELAEALSLCSLSVDQIEKSPDGDSLYHIEVPPNRYDCLSVMGVAREAAAVLPRFGHPATLSWSAGTPRKGASSSNEVAPLPSPEKNKLSLQVRVDPNLCPHFAAIVMDKVKIKPSPTIVRQRLEKAGVRALNNVIDATNYLMLETGQPMHAFDYDKLSTSHDPQSKLMRLRESRVGEWLVTLDGVKRQLPVGSIVIADGEKLIDLCGLMGGENSAIDEKTERVILFAQIYEPVHIRKTSMALPLRTQSAQRFEKGLDPEAVRPTLYQSVKMLQANASGQAASPLYNFRQKPFQPHQVSLGLEKLHQYLGIILPTEEVVSILASLGFQLVAPSSPSTTPQFTVPSWRAQDITIEEDLIEEVARLYGYHNLPTTLPVGEPAQAQPEPRFAYEHRLKFLLKDLGFTEVYTSSLVSQELAGDGALLRVTNPLGPETEYLKADPFPQMIAVAQENLTRSFTVSLFEIGNNHRPPHNGELPKETTFLTVALTANENREKAFLKVKGLVERICREFNVQKYTFTDKTTFPYAYKMPLEHSTTFVIWPPKKSATGTILGVGGLASGADHLWLFKINLAVLWENIAPRKTFTPPPAHPPLLEEISFYLPQKVTYAQAVEVIQAAGGGVLKEVTLADYYIEENLQKKGQKSLTLKLTFAAPRQTLESKELQPVREKIIQTLQEKLHALVRTKN